MAWAIAIPLIVIAVCFFILAIGLLIALFRTVSILRDIEDKLHALNPLCRLVHRLGDIADERVEEWGERRRTPARDVIDLIMWGISKIKEWRK